LKSYLIVLNRYVAGTPVTNNWDLPSPIGLTNGLPTVLPLSVRQKIRRLNKTEIRIWASVFNSYKGIWGEHPEPDYSSIVSPMPSIDLSEWKIFVPIFWKWIQGLADAAKVNVEPDFRNVKPFVSMSSGPNERISFLGYAADAAAWGLRPISNKVDWVEKWLERVGDTMTLHMYKTIQKYALQAHFSEDSETAPPDQGFNPNAWMRPIKGFFPSSESRVYRTPILGKLAKKEEAAGKVRIFAIVDYWTQYCLKPVHDWMFSILRLLPTDATFNQDGSLKTLVDIQSKFHWDYDLKSATDLIPRPLYEALFSVPFGPDLSSLWMNLLSDRDFRVVQLPVPSFRDWLSLRDIQWSDYLMKSTYNRLSLKLRHKRYVEKIRAKNRRFVSYGTGQPMGALSSWASLALVHHAIIQFSAWKNYRFPYPYYRVLGDDNEIAHDKVVAQAYVQSLAEFRIKTGGLKDFVSSRGFLNFANQSYINLTNISPMSLKEEIQCVTAQARVASAYRILSRWDTVNVNKTGYLKSLLGTVANPKQYGSVIKWFFGGPLSLSKKLFDVRILLTLLTTSPLVTNKVFGVSPSMVFPRIGLADPEVDLRRKVGEVLNSPLDVQDIREIEKISNYMERQGKRIVGVLRDTYKHQALAIEDIFQHLLAEKHVVNRMFFTWLICKTNPTESRKVYKLGNAAMARCVNDYIFTLRASDQSLFDNHPEGYGNKNSPISSLFSYSGIRGIARDIRVKPRYDTTYGLLIKGLYHKVESAGTLENKCIAFDSLVSHLQDYAPYTFAMPDKVSPFKLSSYEDRALPAIEMINNFHHLSAVQRRHVALREALKKDPYFNQLNFMYKSGLAPSQVISENNPTSMTILGMCHPDSENP